MNKNMIAVILGLVALYLLQSGIFGLINGELVINEKGSASETTIVPPNSIIFSLVLLAFAIIFIYIVIQYFRNKNNKK